MKLRLMTALGTALFAVLLLAPGTATALDADDQPGQVSSGRALMQQNANESAQATTDMSFSESPQGAQNVSYGGVKAAHTQTGWRQDSACASGQQCSASPGR